ncbi:hypothetical protein DENSPDRAFT_921395, partial [Dentipellis sp. KUC8613]
MASSASSGGHTTCPVLHSQDDFRLWQVRIKSKLGQEKVLAIVTGEETASSALAAASVSLYSPSYVSSDTFATQNRKAHGIIVEYISDELAMEYAHIDSAKDLYDTLVKLFEKANAGVTGFYTFVDMMNARWDGAS